MLGEDTEHRTDNFDRLFWLIAFLFIYLFFISGSPFGYAIFVIGIRDYPAPVQRPAILFGSVSFETYKPF